VVLTCCRKYYTDTVSRCRHKKIPRTTTDNYTASSTPDKRMYMHISSEFHIILMISSDKKKKFTRREKIWIIIYIITVINKPIRIHQYIAESYDISYLRRLRNVLKKWCSRLRTIQYHYIGILVKCDKKNIVCLTVSRGTCPTIITILLNY